MVTVQFVIKAHVSNCGNFSDESRVLFYSGLHTMNVEKTSPMGVFRPALLTVIGKALQACLHSVHNIGFHVAKVQSQCIQSRGRSATVR